MKIIIFYLFCGVIVILSMPLASEQLKNRKIRMVGGFKNGISNIPYQASIAVNGEHICGGSIIEKSWILSAAHCVNNLALDDISVRVGSSNSNSRGKVHQVKQIIKHRRYNPTTQNYDFALIELETKIKIKSTQKVVTLPTSTQKVVDGSMCIGSGWGLTHESSIDKTVLRSAYLPVFNHENCSLYYDTGLTKQMMCAGYTDGKVDTCQGDSGGPLVCDNILMGVVSFGDGCGKREKPGIYGYVPAVRRWIEVHTGI